MPASLVIENLPGVAKVIVPYPLNTEVVHVGRSSMNGIIIDNALVARCHAKISQVHEAYILEDLGSRSGTFVNSKRIRSHALTAGDEIQIGETSLRFVVAEPDSETTALTADLPSACEALEDQKGNWITLPTLWIERLVALSKWFASIGENFSLLDSLAESLIGTFKCQRVHVVIFEERRVKPLLKVVRSTSPCSLPLESPENESSPLWDWVLGGVVRQGEPVRVDALRKTLPNGEPNEFDRQLLVVPCNTYKQSLGVLVLERDNKNLPFDEVEGAFATLVAGQLTLYLRYNL